MDSASSDFLERHHCPWTPSTARATAQVRSLWARQNRQMLEYAERQLLLPYLTRVQEASLNERGWCDLPWIEQGLLLRLHTNRMPTVDVYRLRNEYDALSYWGVAVSRRGAGTYLCSFDVRRASDDVLRHLPHTSSVPSGLVRRVIAAHECGTLTALLQASGLLHQPIDTGEPDDAVGRITSAAQFQNLCGVN